MNILVIGLLLMQAQVASVNGTVNRPGSNDPVGGATVTLNPVLSTQTARTRTTVTEDDGRFAIDSIEPGEYRLQVQTTRYGSAAYGQRKPNGPGSILTFAPGQRLSDIRISMVPTGTIAGRVTGRSGEPIAYANVVALRYQYQEGKRILAAAQTATTDDRGEYRLYWLTSGKYLIVAGPGSPPAVGAPPRPIRPGETLGRGLPAIGPLASVDALLEGTNQVTLLLEDGTVEEQSWMPTYYPATTDRSQATEVEVAAGATVTNVEITLGPSRVQKIRGRVTGSTPGTPVMVTLAAGSQGTTGRGIGQTAAADGSFQFVGVAPGAYFLTARDAVGAPVGGGAMSGLVSAPVAVLVGERDVEGLTLGLGFPLTLQTRITLEGVTQSTTPGATAMTPGATDPLSGVVGILRGDSDALQGGSPANLRNFNSQIGSAGQMVFIGLAPGEYQFSISQPGVGVRENAKPLYIKSLRLGREDAMGTFRVSSDTKDVLEIVLTTATGSVSGVVLGRSGDPAANATVVLVPTNARKRSSHYKTLVTGSDGKFSFQEIPAGDYKLFAWDDVETGAWENAEFIHQYESRGRDIRIVEGGKEEAQLSVIYNP